MSGRNVEFTITAANKDALNSLDAFLRRLDRIRDHKAFQKINQHLTRQRRDWVQIRNHIRDATRDYNRLAAAAKRWSDMTKSIGRTNVKIVNQVRNTATATERAAQQAGRMQRAWTATRTLVKSVVTNLSKVATLTARGAVGGSAALRGGATSIAGSIQGIGISTRMSGIAMAQQLGQIMAGPLSGNIMSGVLQGLRGALNISAGLVTIAAEMGVRIASGIAGGLVKAGGLLMGGVAQALGGMLAGVFSIANGPLGLIVNSVSQGIGNVIASVSTIAGEMVGQIGNVLTGLGEVFRGAFQAAVNVASGVLNGLVSFTQGLVEKIGGMLGTIGKTVLGVAGTIGGFAIRDIVKAEGAMTRGFVLLDPSVTSEQRDSIREWAYNIRRELGNIKASDPGLAVERAISTGFQKDPEGAMQFATHALRLVSTVGDEDAGVVTRAAAKVWMAFKDELIAQAGGDSGEAMRLLFDKMFAVKNFGDLDLGDLAVRIGDVEGPAKSLGMSLDDMLTTISQLSLVLGKEQTFTAFGQMMTTFTKMREQGFSALKKANINIREFSPQEQEKLNALYEKREKAMRKSAKYAQMTDRIRDLQAEKGVAKSDKEKDRIDKEIKRLKREQRDYAQRYGDTNVRGIQKEIDAFEQQEGKLRSLVDVWKELLEALNKGTLNEAKLGRIVSNIRALRGVLGLDALQKAAPKEFEAVREGVVETAKGGVERAQGIRAEDFGTQMLKILHEIKQPFIQFWLTNREAVSGFAEHLRSKLADFNKWWKSALEHEGAGEFAANLKEKMAGLFDWLPGGDAEVDPGAFWDAMNNGLNAVWDVGGRVAGVIKDIFKTVGNVATAIGGWGAIWGGIKTAVSGVADEIERISENDFSTWEDIWTRVKDKADELWTSVKLRGVEALMTVTRVLDEFIQKALAGLEQLANKATAVFGAMAAWQMGMSFMGPGMMMPGRGGVPRGGMPGGGGVNPMAANAAATGASMLPSWMNRMSQSRKLAMLQGMKPGLARTQLANQLGIRLSDRLAGRSGFMLPAGAQGARGAALSRLGGLGRGAGTGNPLWNSIKGGAGKLGRGAGALGRGAGRMLLPVALAMSAWDAINIIGGTPPPEQKSFGDSAMTVGGMTAAGFGVGGPIGAGIGFLAGMGLDQYDRHKRRKEMEKIKRQQERHQTLYPLASGQGYYDPQFGNFIDYKQHGGKNKDLLDQYGAAFAQAQMITMDPQRSEEARTLAGGVIDALYEELTQKIKERSEAEFKQGVAEKAKEAMQPIVTEVSGLAAQFPEDATLQGLKKEVKRLADEMSKMAMSTGEYGGSFVAKAEAAARKAREAGDAATTAGMGLHTGDAESSAMAGFTQRKGMGAKIKALLKQGRRTRSITGYSGGKVGPDGKFAPGQGKNAFHFYDDDVGFLPKTVRDQIMRHQESGTLTEDIIHDLLGKVGLAPRYENQFTQKGTVTVPSGSPSFPGGDPHGFGKPKPPPSNKGGEGDYGIPGARWHKDRYGYTHYTQYDRDPYLRNKDGTYKKDDRGRRMLDPNAQKLFDHTFMRMVRNDPFQQGPMQAGQFGFATGSLGRRITNRNQFGAFGIRNGGIDPETGKTRSAKFQNPFSGTVADPRNQRSNAEVAAEDNFRRLRDKLQQTADRLKEAAKKVGGEEGKRLAEQAAKMEEAAKGINKSTVKAIDNMGNAAKQLGEAAKEGTAVAKEGFEAAQELIAELRKEIEDLRAQVEALKANQQEGNG